MTDTPVLTRAEVREAVRRRDAKARRKEARDKRPKPARPIATGQRDPREKNGAYLSAIRTCPCIYCLAEGKVQTTRTEAAHVKTGYPEAGRGWRHFGVQEKSHDWRALPACADHHRLSKDAQHNHGERAWLDGWGLYAPMVCRVMHSAWNSTGDLSEATRAVVMSLQPDLRKRLNGKVERRGAV